MEAALLPKGMGGSEDENGTECFLTTSYFKQTRPQVHWVFFFIFDWFRVALEHILALFTGQMISEVTRKISQN